MATQTQYPLNLPFGYLWYKALQNCRIQGRDGCLPLYVGGVKSALFALKSSAGFLKLNNAGQVTGFTNNLAIRWVNLNFLYGSGSLSTVWVKSESGESYDSTLAFTIGEKDPVTRNVLSAYLKQEIVAIVFDLNNRAWLVGWDFAFKNHQITEQTGGGKNDLNGYAVTMKTSNRLPPRSITEATLQALILDYTQNCTVPFAQTLPAVSLQNCLLSSYNSTPLF